MTKPGYVSVDIEKVKKAIGASPFSRRQVSVFLGHNGSWVDQLILKGYGVSRADLDKIVDLIGGSVDDLIAGPVVKEEKKSVDSNVDNTEVIKLLASINAHLANIEQYLNNVNARTKAIDDDLKAGREESHKDLNDLHHHLNALAECWK